MFYCELDLSLHQWFVWKRTGFYVVVDSDCTYYIQVKWHILEVIRFGVLNLQEPYIR